MAAVVDEPDCSARLLRCAELTSVTIARAVSSWRFILMLSSCMCVWVLLNAGHSNTYDPYPYVLLNLVLSFIAAYTAPFIMMSQHLESESDRDRDASLQEKADCIRLSHLPAFADHADAHTRALRNSLRACRLLLEQRRRTNQTESNSSAEHTSCQSDVNTSDIEPVQLNMLPVFESGEREHNLLLRRMFGQRTSRSRSLRSDSDEAEKSDNEDGDAEFAALWDPTAVVADDGDNSDSDSEMNNERSVRLERAATSQGVSEPASTHHSIDSDDIFGLSAWARSLIGASIAPAVAVAVNDIELNQMNTDPSQVPSQSVPVAASCCARFAAFWLLFISNTLRACRLTMGLRRAVQASFKQFWQRMLYTPAQLEYFESASTIATSRSVCQCRHPDSASSVDNSDIPVINICRTCHRRRAGVSEPTVARVSVEPSTDQNSRILLAPPRLSQRSAEVCGAKVGSWAFVALQTMWLLSWVLLNTLLPAVNTDIGASVNPTSDVEISWWSLLIKGKAWDPYPFVFLNLLLSALSALTAPVIMMAQRAQHEVDRMQSTELHFKLDYIRTRQLQALAARANEHARLARYLQRDLRALLDVESLSA